MFRLSRRKGSTLWQVRKRWPADVAAILKGEFNRSTGEAERKLAEARLPAIAADYQARVDEARRRLADNRFRDLSENEINRLAAKFYAQMLPRYRLSKPLSPVERQQMLKDTRETLQTLAGNLGSNDASPVAAVTSRLIDQEGLPIPEDSPSLAALQLLVLRAFVELHKGVVSQLEGQPDYRPADERVAELIDREGKPKRTVRELIKAYREEKEDSWSQSTHDAFGPVERLLKDTVGDREPSTINREDARKIQQLIRSLPLNLGKRKALKGLTVPQAVETARKLGLPTINPNTANRGYLVHIAGLFNFARKEEWTATNPFEGLTIHDPVAREDKRDPFSVEQLQVLFGAAPWKPRNDSPDGKPSRFWVPLLCAFHGLRLGEAAGLLVEHVQENEGTPVLLLKAYEGRRLKTKSSRGTLPVHPELVRIGFLDFVQQQRDAGAERLFPDAKTNANGKVGAKLGEWFSKLVKDRGLKGIKLGMHSFRHSFEDRLREAELVERTALALGRRAERGAVAGYGDGVPIRVLSAAMAKVEYPGLDLSHLYTTDVAEAA